MQFRIADTFTDSLARLTVDEQKAVKTTAFDLQVNPAQPGMQFHRLDRARDRKFWSVRAGRDIRLIVHRTDSALLLCYADHHDRAYQWAERRRLETHPTTGAAQLVEIRETVQEVLVPIYVQQKAPAPAPPRPVLEHVSQEDLLEYGVPPEWVEEVRRATEDSVLTLTDHLPDEAAEAVLELATGGRPVLPVKIPVGDPFEHPDARRRFRLMQDVEELERALDFPWEKWTIFLHPAQREWVERDFAGPARVSGSAGTGKTIVALHRAAFLARVNPDARILLTTFSDTLASALRSRFATLVGHEPRLAERVEVHSIDAVGERLYAAHFGTPRIATRQVLRDYLGGASVAAPGHRFSDGFLLSEWEHVVDPWQLDAWEAYRDVQRLGRKTRLPEQQRALLWSIFEQLRSVLADDGFVTRPSMFTALARHYAEAKKSPYDFAVVDEAQDMGVSELRFFAALAGDRPNGLFFAGDLGQRIFQQPFSWRALGVDIRGRAKILKVNYRTSHQIRHCADGLLDPVQTDADGNRESRAGAISAFNGAPPDIRVLEDEAAEIEAVASWVQGLVAGGLAPEELALFVRSEAEIKRALRVVDAAGLPSAVLDEKLRTTKGSASVGTMHLAKGLEFRAVVVMACDDEVIPSQERIQAIADNADLEDVYTTERHLLYVACTRARDHLFVSGVAPASEFLEDLAVRHAVSHVPRAGQAARK